MESTFSTVEPESCPVRAKGMPKLSTTHATKSDLAAKLLFPGTYMMRMEDVGGSLQRKEYTITVSETK